MTRRVFVLTDIAGTVYGVFTTKKKAEYWAKRIEQECHFDNFHIDDISVDRCPEILWEGE